MPADAPLGFFSESLDKPCRGCSAPCCRGVVLQHATPTKWMDLDFIRYMLGFQRINVLVAEDGRWSILVNDICSKLDQRTNLCTVHGTAGQPATCKFYSPHHCWYKRNFDGDPVPTDFIRLDLARFEVLLQKVELDAQGQLIGWPGWVVMKELFDGPRPGAPTEETVTSPGSETPSGQVGG